MIYDPVGDRIVVFGGYNDINFMNDTWQLSLSGTPAWTQLSPATSPPARYGHSAIYDPLRMRMIIFGGASTPPLTFYNDAWSFDLVGASGWTQLVLDNAPPLERDFSAMVYDDAHDRAVVYGGNVPSGTIASQVYAEVLGDVWTLDMPGLPTAVQVSTARAKTDPDLVTLEWQVSALGRRYEVLRSASAGGWEVMTSVDPDGMGRIGWQDGTVRAGADYDYALRYVERGATVLAGQTHVRVPLAYRLGITAPAIARESTINLQFVLPDASPSQLEVFDTSGRRVLQRDLGAFGAGRHSLQLPADGWTAGVYWVRITRPEGSVQQRLVRFQ